LIHRGTVACLGLSQFVSWGISYYLIGLFGDSIASDLRWPSDVVYGGFAWALLVMGLASPLVGRANHAPTSRWYSLLARSAVSLSAMGRLYPLGALASLDRGVGQEGCNHVRHCPAGDGERHPRSHSKAI
jgi:hypothetical protein